MTDHAERTGWALAGGLIPGAEDLDDLVPLLYYDDPGSNNERSTEALEIRQLVFISLFSDARADPADELLASTDGKLDRRGWWAESLGEDPADRFGSRLWLLSRSKETPETRALARDYAEESLAWIVSDGLAEAVDVRLIDTNRLGAGLLVRVTRGDGVAFEIRHPSLWEDIQHG